MKLQPNFSWQKYEGKPEDQGQQFQKQLQQEHIVVANAVNSTIDDISYFTQERATSETWVDSRQIYNKTFQALVSAFPITHGIVGLRSLISVVATIQDAIPLTDAYQVAFADPTTSTNDIGINVTDTQIFLLTAGGIYDTYTASITLLYTKV